ncbi:putative uncharacterized protein DDB_G0287113 [Drosophila navojoa]|uniref:putative uncharacterized protein DDB_G0287113 n=1 Tax=Drosophila navojoa TaxID=7232 RepID=UPI0011BF17E8|nr:putative uncharacterized protein DDB_G0287113 [Drosophila navojoa]XP_030240128.1 putative uncharacterized protein DDB_G0287113 [Drosophila navojoa]
MANCDVQATPSDENKIEDPAQAESVNKFEERITKSGTVHRSTRIPGPIRLDENGCYVQTSTRKYTSLMKTLQMKSEMNDSFSSTSTLVNTTEDSGVQLDCSTTVDDDDSSSEILTQSSNSTPCEQRSSETIATSERLDELEAAEQQTLRVLQRAVAEMEADVALHAEILEEQITLELENQLNLHIENEIQKEIEKTLIQQTMDQQEQQQDEEQQEQQQSEEAKSIQELEFELELNLQLIPEPANHQTDFIDLCQPLDGRETSNPSPRAGTRERKHVRVEELLEAEHDMELLHKLLQVDNDQYTGEVGALPQPHEVHCLSDLNAGRDILVNLDRITTDDEPEWHRKRLSIFQSLLQIICGNRIRKLSYPILFCGMAVGLIYYFRKN